MRHSELVTRLRQEDIRVKQGDFILIWYHSYGDCWYKVYKIFTPKEVVALTESELNELISEFRIIELFS